MLYKSEEYRLFVNCWHLLTIPCLLLSLSGIPLILVTNVLFTFTFATLLLPKLRCYQRTHRTWTVPLAILETLHFLEYVSALLQVLHEVVYFIFFPSPFLFGFRCSTCLLFIHQNNYIYASEIVLDVRLSIKSLYEWIE